MPFNSNGKQQLLNSPATQKTAELENVTSSKTVNVSFLVPSCPTETYRLRASQASKTCRSKSCSQCQNRGQVEVYGGWLVFTDWLGDDGGDAETGGWELLYAKASGGQQAAI